MQAKLIPIFLATGLLLQGCGGPRWKTSEKWRETCASDAGTHIARTVRDVDGFIFEGVSRGHTNSSLVKSRWVYPVVPFFSLFSARQKRYRYIEISVPEGGIYGLIFAASICPKPFIGSRVKEVITRTASSSSCSRTSHLIIVAWRKFRSRCFPPSISTRG